MTATRTRIALLALLAAGCDDCKTTPPKPENCVEFDHFTERGGKVWRCRMVWCEEGTISTKGSVSSTGGVASLWCEPDDADGGVH